MRLLSLSIALSASVLAQTAGDWPTYGGDPGGTRYSTLKQIDRANITKLRVAWTYHTGALEPKTDLNHKAAFEATPILFEGALYLSTPYDQVIALDPASGAERWKYDPDVNRHSYYSEVTSRGVSSWVDSTAAPGAVCRTRIFIGTIDARMIALDAKTGKKCAGFGVNGEIDLSKNVDVASRRGDYEVTSPPAVAGDVVVTGSSIGDGRAVDVERGIVRAFDARTGKLLWTWDPIPWAATQNPRTGAANAWSIISVDAKRGLVFIPTGSASPDIYGGLRPGDNKHANSVVALRARTGELVWSFQAVHHDLWDYDVASQPTLFTYRGRPAVAVTTKMGNVFVLDRETGKPLRPVQEKPVPKSRVEGEQTSATQPFSDFAPLVPQALTAADAWGPTAADRDFCRAKIAAVRNEGIFTPPDIGGSIAVPGNVGGVNWGSAAIDPGRGLLLANTNRLPFLLRLIPRDKLKDEPRNLGDNRLGGDLHQQRKTPYAMYREVLASPSGLPCAPPPWGALVALDVNAGRIAWQAPLGSMGPNLPPGAPGLGGPMITAGGLVFTGAAMDSFLRAFDIDTGKEIWKAELPASAQATPMTYRANGRQFVVICAGGHGKLGSKQGDAVVAFTLPETAEAAQFQR
jgi:quinoprotein glucose dehydrogenase